MYEKNYRLKRYGHALRSLVYQHITLRDALKKLRWSGKKSLV